MSRTQKLKGFAAASLRLKTLNDNPYLLSALEKQLSENHYYNLSNV